MPQSRLYTNADLLKKPQEPELDLTPADDNQLDLTPAGWDNVDLTAKTPSTQRTDAAGRKIATPIDQMGRAIAPPTVNPLQEIPDENQLFTKEHVLKALTDPLTDLPTRAGEWLGKKINPNPEKVGYYDPRNLAGAFAESLGHEASGLTNPINLGLTLATEGGSALARSGTKAALKGLEAGIPETDAAVEAIKQTNRFRAANAARQTARALALPQVYESGKTILDPNATWEQRLEAAPGLVLGGMALKSYAHPFKNEVAETLSQPVQGPEVPRGFTKPVELKNVPDSNQPKFDFEKVPSKPREQPSLFDEGDLHPTETGHLPNEFLPDQPYQGRAIHEPTLPTNPKDFVQNLPDKGEFKESPFPKVDDKVLDEIIRNKQVDYQNPRLERVPLADLKGTQDTVTPEAVDKYIEQGDRPELTQVPEANKGRMDSEAPVAIKIGDEYVLAGGHHRATADLANGKSDMQAVVYDAKVPPELLDKFKASLERDKAFLNRNKMAEKPYEYKGEMPEEMRAINKPENVAIGPYLDPPSRRLLDVLGNSLYASGDRMKTATKELLQNAQDEHKIAGKTDSHIKVVFQGGDVNPHTGEKGGSLIVRDQGRGVPKDQIYSVLTNLAESGKLNEETASGGFGLAKASPMLGGRHVRFESVVDEGGQRVKYSFEGTPDQLKNQEEGVPLTREVVDKSVPTGLMAKVHYDDKTDYYDSQYQAKRMAEHSYGGSPIQITSRLGKFDPEDLNNFLNGTVKKGDYNTAVEHAEVHHPLEQPELQDTVKIPGADINIHYKNPVGNVTKGYNLHTLNNGLYQFSSPWQQSYGAMGALRDVPSDITTNIKATVPEGHENYPFGANREKLNDKVNEAIRDWIQKNLVSGALEKNKNRLLDMYKGMKPLGGTPKNRPGVVFDPHNLYTPQELDALGNNPVMDHFLTIIDHTINNVLEAVGNKKWSDRLERVGINLDPGEGGGLFGIHIPHPESGKSTILVNPFTLANHFAPNDLAAESVSTAWHEAGHIGSESNYAPGVDLSKVDANHPALRDFMQSYMSEVGHANAVGDEGHGLSFLRRLGEIYSSTGIEPWDNAIRSLDGVLRDQTTGEYTPEFQNLLQQYNEKVGATSFEKDILSRTGEQSAITPGGKGSNVSNVEPNGKGTTIRNPGQRPVNLGKQLTADFNKPIKHVYEEPPTQDVVNKIQQDIPQPEIIKRVSNISKHTSKDALAAEGVTKDEAENLVEKALNFQRTLLTSYDVSGPGRQGLALIHRKEWWTSWNDMFKSWGSEKAYNNVMRSIREDPSGLFKAAPGEKSFANEAKLDLTDALNHKEEIFRSRWAEDYIPGVRPSVRAYTAFLNKLRADTFKNMVKTAGAENNLPVAKQIADFINVATGRGSLGAFEPAAKPLAQIFFSPRLTASRLQMYTRTLNPKFYADSPPVVRQQQLKSALALAGTGLLIGQLSKLAGATVNSDPYNSDFGKIKFGKTRIDPFAGHQQFLVAAARLLMGKSTSSTTGKTSDLNHPHFGGTTRADVFGRFLSNKLAPVPSFVWSWMQGREFDGTPFDAKKEMLSRTVPIVMQDLNDIAKSDPTLLQAGIASAASIGGFGVQTYGR